MAKVAATATENIHQKFWVTLYKAKTKVAKILLKIKAMIWYAIVMNIAISTFFLPLAKSSEYCNRYPKYVANTVLATFVIATLMV